MTQYQQVIAAVKKLNGKGTADEIYKAIDGIENWGTQTKRASVYSYLARGDAFLKEGDYWVLKNIIVDDDKEFDEEEELNDETVENQNKNNNDIKDSTLRGLYFITIGPIVNLQIAGLLFKIGRSKNVKKRLKSYGLWLPFDPICLQGFYRIPSDINLKQVEDLVRTELLTNDSLDIKIEKYSASNQIEWLQTLDLPYSKENLNKLAVIVNKVVKDTISNLREKDNYTKEENV